MAGGVKESHGEMMLEGEGKREGPRIVVVGAEAFPLEEDAFGGGGWECGLWRCASLFAGGNMPVFNDAQRGWGLIEPESGRLGQR